jgi:hypothetical protein
VTDWTPVSEALPPSGAAVLVTTTGRLVRVAWFEEQAWYAVPGSVAIGVVAWQPLPAPYVAPAAPAAGGAE